MGRLGKDRNPACRWQAGLLAAMLAGCAAAGRDGRYAGPVTAEIGVCDAGDRTNRSAASLLVRGDEVIFAPSDGVLLLRGRIEATGRLTATATMPGADHKPFPMVFEGELHDGQIEGRYATPRCRAAVRLARVR